MESRMVMKIGEIGTVLPMELETGDHGMVSRTETSIGEITMEKPMEMPIVVSKMKKLCFLMDYKIYFENVDMMTEVEDRDSKYLETICEKRKRIFYALAKASKRKDLPKNVIDHIVSDYLI